MNARLRPLWPYYGAKWMLAPHYPPPRHDLIVEPFAGSACYALLHHQRDVLLIDANADVVDTWRYLLAASASEILDLPDLPESGVVADLRLPRGPELLIRWWINRAQAAPARRASSWCRDYPERHWGARSRQRLAATVPHIRHWRAQHGHHIDAPAAEATWFVDPPYAGRPGQYYPHGSGRIDYAGLAAWCRGLPGQAIVCEHATAQWLPFTPLRLLRSAGSPGAHRLTMEGVWVSEAAAERQGRLL